MKVSKQAQEKSYQNYLMDYEKRTVYETEMEEMKQAEREPVEYSKEKILEAV